MEFLKPSRQKRFHGKMVFHVLPFLFLLPFLFGNKGCDKTFTWGDINKDVVAKWEDDHKDMDRDTKCSDCHDAIKNKNSRPKSHDVVWEREHGKYAQLKFGFRDENVCRLCHTDSTCTQCHQIEEPQNHTMFWKLRGHGVSVGLNRSTCAVCHAGTDFCERCHSETKPTNHIASWGNTTNNHCMSCHFPITSAGDRKSVV